MPGKITVVGSLNYDLVTYTDVFPDAGETVQAKSLEKHVGGKGLNEAIAASKLNRKGLKYLVRMIGKVGDDIFGEELKNSLQKNHVDIKLVETLKGVPSGTAVIIVEPSGENRILINAGANGELRPSAEDYERYFPKEDTESQFVMLQNEYPDTENTVSWLYAHRKHIKIAYNPSPFKPEIFTENFLKKITLLIVNEGEAITAALALSGQHTLDLIRKQVEIDKREGLVKLGQELCKYLKSDGESWVIVTAGSFGSVFVCLSGVSGYSGRKKASNVVDTTGAGDTFFGAVVSTLLCTEDYGDHVESTASNNENMAQAIEFASQASALAIQKRGAAESIPMYEEVMNSYKDETKVSKV